MASTAERTDAGGQGDPVHIRSKRFGDLDVPRESIFEFPEGLVGFPGAKRFVLLDHRPGSTFKWMLSVDDPELGFAVADPSDLVVGYVAPFEAATRAVGADPADMVIFALVTIPQNPTEMTVNLMAPVAVNLRSRIARQLVLEDPKLDAAHRVFAG
jgi:flagellar assembly factor FliW